MDSPTRPILSPSKVLHPVSPERMNQQSIPASPSLPSDLLSLHHKNTKGVSEVQAKVAFLNNLSSQGSPVAQGQQASNNAALQRAILGREEAESALASVQEELSEAQSRERRISERLESLLEELHGTKERQAHERSIFEKEIRKARKEAFRTGSSLVKLQEELKHSKSEAKALKDELAAEREAKDKAKQDAFERAYALAGLTEEFEVLKGRLRSMEASNHSNSLEVRAHEIQKEDFGRLSLAEGDLAFLTTPRRPKRVAADSVMSPETGTGNDHSAEVTPPKRQRLSECTTAAEEDQRGPTESLSQSDSIAFERLREELGLERYRRTQAEEMVHFLNIECQFERCSCRIAESQGRRYIYDTDFFEKYQRPHLEAEAAQRAEASRPPTEVRRAEEARHVEIARKTNENRRAPEAFNAEASRRTRTHETQVLSSHTPSAEPPTPVHRGTETTVKPEPTDPPEQMPMPEEPLVTFSPETGTFKTFPSPLREDARPRGTDSFPAPELTISQSNRHSGSMNSATSRRCHGGSSARSEDQTTFRQDRATPSEILTRGSVDASTTSETRPTRSAVREDCHQPTHSTTKRVPIREATESRNSSSALVPDTPINREEALAKIRERRGRARSKQRSVSANETSGRSTGSTGSTGTSTGTTPGRGPRRIPNLRGEGQNEKEIGERRDLSAPVRMFRR